MDLLICNTCGTIFFPTLAVCPHDGSADISVYNSTRHPPPFINVLDYRADISGTVDAWAAIQDAIDAASELVEEDPTGASDISGAVVLLPPGYYLISDKLTIEQHGVILRGAGRISTRIIADSSFPASTPMVEILQAPSSTTVFDSRLEDLTLNCNDVTGSIGVLTHDGQEGVGLKGVRVRNYKGTGFKAVTDGSGEDAAEIVIEDCEFWASSGGSTYGIDFDTTSGASYVSRTTILALSDWTLGTSHTAAIHVEDSFVSCRDIHIEDYFDGILVDSSGTVAASNVNGNNGPGQDATHALIHLTTTGRGVFESTYCGTGNTFYIEAYSRLSGAGYYNRYSVADPAGLNVNSRVDNSLGIFEARSAKTTVPALVLRNTTGGGTVPVIQQHDQSSNTTFQTTANGTTTVGRSGVTQWDNGHLIIGAYHLWVDNAAGVLRIKSGAPTSDTDGTVVGTQT